jgi:protein TonB
LNARSDGSVAAAKPLASKLGAHPAPTDPGRTPPAPGFERIKPGAPPEGIFGPKRIYTLHVNMPNLASVTGSWILSFVEMQDLDEAHTGRGQVHSDLSGPVPLHKVDPKYPPALIQARVEGEVVLYAIIRKDGSVDSIQLVRGIEPQLDTNAMEALARWKFRPAERKGAPVELEAIVHIPFRSVAPLY